MTEDDTFNKLRRPNIHELHTFLHTWFMNYHDRREIAEMLGLQCWTLEEYVESCSTHGIIPYDD